MSQAQTNQRPERDADEVTKVEFARGRKLQQVGGNSWGVTFPIDVLQEAGVVDENGDLVDEEAQARMVALVEDGQPVQLRSEVDFD